MHLGKREPVVVVEVLVDGLAIILELGLAALDGAGDP